MSLTANLFMEIKSNLKTDRLNSIPPPLCYLSPLPVAQKQQTLAQLLTRIHVAQTQRCSVYATLITVVAKQLVASTLHLGLWYTHNIVLR